jgi:4-hydroxybenzoate polyprenyltransferase
MVKLTFFNDYLKLIKFRYHLSFISVIIGCLIFGNSYSFWDLVSLLILVYISFNLLLYTGFYILNDLFDVKSDQKHFAKRFRPIASGRISISSAILLAILNILLGLSIGFIIDTGLLLFYICFLIINLFYTLIAKKIPYLEIIINATTHPLRLIMGSYLVGSKFSLLFVLAYFILAISISTKRRITEMNYPSYESRKVLQSYKLKTLNKLLFYDLIIILLIFIIDFNNNFIAYMSLILLYVILIYLENYFKFFKNIWLK